MFEAWYKTQEVSGKGEQKRAKENEKFEEVSSLFQNETHLVDKNVVRKKILEALGQRLNKFEGSKDQAYFLDNFYDPLSQSMYLHLSRPNL